ncbi:hypothetical protein CC80DRAFT_498090 [Byssothecium circinans]|uniref:LysM domain-containing protein n=1 Tax=Byssothecium circinans TaxID=147558 RepID=A0A6A5T9R6_9PLEO|nr:hypothetical protein CC80DRAFT_498199 [Byssothecium circinans]KAF1948595.1 hypothetical protein CC80DRAFT_498090 [Byssothecium circinans]
MQFSTSYIIAASQLFAFAMGAPLLNADAQEARGLVERAAYKVFGGDGSAAQGWPKMSDWKDFETLWKANEKTMGGSCTQFNQKNNSPEETANIKKAIAQVSKETNIKDVFLLSILMQESKGCVRAPTTNYGFDNPGLMQSFQGKNSCFNVNPCPSDKIVGMIRDGAGIGAEAGLQQSIKTAGGSDAQTYYKASRVYNSGSLSAGPNLGAGIATHCYASDVANRLIGWDDSSAHGCEEATIGSKGGSSTSTPTPATSSTPATSNTPVTASGSCKKSYTVKAGDTCASTGASVADLVKLNPGLKSDCTNLQAGKSYCLEK